MGYCLFRLEIGVSLEAGQSICCTIVNLLSCVLSDIVYKYFTVRQPSGFRRNDWAMIWNLKDSERGVFNKNLNSRDFNHEF